VGWAFELELDNKNQKNLIECHYHFSFKGGCVETVLVRLERRDRLQHKPMNIADLQKMTPAINWNSYFTEIDFTKLDTVIVAQPKYERVTNNSFRK
jgi:hypothetical protein